jgi:hypothetical protein
MGINLFSSRSDASGVLNAVAHSKVTVGIGASVVLKAANPARRALVLLNQSANPVYVNLGTAGVVATGYRLAQNEQLVLSRETGLLYLGAVNAISTGGNADVSVIEGT